MKHNIPFIGIVVFSIMLLAHPVSAEFGTAWEAELPEGVYPKIFLGSVNMDDDKWEELVYFESYPSHDRILIINGANGAIDWDSEDWEEILIAGHWTGDAVGGIGFGLSPFCDVDGNGIKEITFYGSKDVNDPRKIFLVGYFPEKGAITTLEPAPDTER